MNGGTLDTAAHVVQLALTPVFFLSGIAALLNVFASRLGRLPTRRTHWRKHQRMTPATLAFASCVFDPGR